MVNSKHSMEQAVSIQKDFESAYAKMSGVVGIGIGLNRTEDDLAINVSVTKPSQAKALPERFNGLDVVVDVVGRISAF
ncbi:hypothetical protein [Mesorhizobium sp. CN2-181]|uniref:hypothetical protein n=1 Tax=Mesorhizobium yinganensis TaxID=3157707 RepID=UPI0032B7E444